MAWTFGDEIEALTSYDANGSGDAISGEDFYLHTNQWLIDGAKEVMGSFPASLLSKCGTRSTLSASTGTTLDLDGMGKISHVTRLSADSGGFEKACRRIAPMDGDLASDSSNMMNYATATDPVYWTTNNSSGNPTLFVLPTPTNAQPAYVHHVSFPTISHSDANIANFPDEAEYLVVLYAAIKALEYTRLQEDDDELYAPQLTNLKQDYTAGIQMLRGPGQPAQGGG